MRLILIVGQPASGKSTFVKSKILPALKNMYVYDVYGYEYPHFKIVQPERYKEGRARYTGSDSEKVLNSLAKFSNTAFIMEDATIFLDNHKKGVEFKRVIYGRRHLNLFIVLIFHALNRVPKWLFEQTNVLVLFKTQDFENDIKYKFKNEKLQAAFERVRVSSNPHSFEIVKFF